jgi:hypothetical protein
MPTDPPTSSTVPLEYAAAPSRWRSRIRRLALGLIVITIAAGAWRYGPHFWHQSQLLYWQRQCMNFSLPPDKVVYEEEPTAAERLLKDSNYSPYLLQRKKYFSDQPPTIAAAAFTPKCILSFCGANIFLSPRQGGRVAVGFLGERISPAGHRRLICATFTPDRQVLPSLFMGIDFDAFTVTPATWTTPPGVPWRPVLITSFARFATEPPLIRAYAGQPDPKDASHFTMRLQMWGQEDEIDGWLKDDDSVMLTARYLPQEPQN